MRLSQLIRKGEYRTQGTHADPEIVGIVRTLSEVRAGVLFVCIRGRQTDTHTMLREIVRAGAAAVVVEIGSGFVRIPGIPILEVPDSRAALATAHSRLAGSPEASLSVIGITGTNGKTSTAHMLCEILRGSGKRVGLIGTVQCSADEGGSPTHKASGAATMTTPEPEVLYPLLAEMRDKGITHVVMEVSSHALIQRRVEPIRFKLGVFTNLSQEHLDYHESMRDYLAAKARLFLQCDAAAVNTDSPYGEEIARTVDCPVYTYSPRGDVGCDAHTTLYNLNGLEGVCVCMEIRGTRISSVIPIPGSFTVENALAAALSADLLGVPSEDTARALSAMKGISGRMERLDTKGASIDILIDYAHTEQALRTLLCSVRACIEGSDRRILLLFGCGGERDRGKRAAMGRCAEELADFTIVTSDNSRREDPKQIIRQILDGMKDRSKRRVILRRDAAIRFAVSIARKGDVLLLVGKGHETYEAVGGRLIPFDERKIAYEALEARKKAHTNAREEGGDGR